jgi:hypothetical protein
MVSSGFRVF